MVLPLLLGVSLGFGLKWKVIQNERQAMSVKIGVFLAAVVVFFLGWEVQDKKMVIIFFVSIIVGCFSRKAEISKNL